MTHSQKLHATVLFHASVNANKTVLAVAKKNKQNALVQNINANVLITARAKNK